MPIYKEGDGPDKMLEDVRKTQKEHDQLMEEAREIFRQDLPPFLALALASRLIGREEAEKLRASISKSSSGQE